MSNRILIYGAYGYTGKLITEGAVDAGLKPLLAGRSREPLEEFAALYGDSVEHRCFSLEDGAVLDDALDGIHTVIHCAGPFSRTAEPMAKACIRTGTHYLDITGEIEVFESLHGLDEKAKAANIMIMPGAGFDIVPSDCLAAHLSRRLPDAKFLVLGLNMSSKPSRGTATTMIENIHRGGMVRENGEIREVPSAWRTRTVDFGDGGTECMTIPWGDVSTAYYSTGIPNIEVYMAMPADFRRMAVFSRYFGFVLGSGPVQAFLKAQIQRQPAGPSPTERETGYSQLWGRVEDEAGTSAETRMRTPEGYALTADMALRIARKVLAGEFTPGFQTPSMAYGPDLILEAEGVTRDDL